MLKEIVLVSLGGALGALARWQVTLYGKSWNVRWEFPVATLGINTLGSLLIGLLGCLLARGVMNPRLALLTITGFLGAFTTFSTFSLETMHLLRTAPWRAGLYIMLTNTLGFAATALAWWGTRTNGES